MAQPRGAVRRQQRGHVGAQQGRGGQQHGRLQRVGDRARPTSRRPGRSTTCPSGELRGDAPAQRQHGEHQQEGGGRTLARGGDREERQQRHEDPRGDRRGCHCRTPVVTGRAPGVAGPRRRCWRSTSSTVPGPRQGTTGQPRPASRSSRLSRSTIRIRQARPAGDGGPPSSSRSRSPSVSMTSTGTPRRTSSARRGDDGRVAASSTGRRRRSRPVTPSSRVRVLVDLTVRRDDPGEGAGQAVEVPGAGAERDAGVARADDPQCRPGRRRRTWCSASADAARTVRSRLLAPPVDAARCARVAQGVHDDEDTARPARPGWSRPAARRCAARPASDPAQPVPGGEAAGSR